MHASQIKNGSMDLFQGINWEDRGSTFLFRIKSN